jgi:hypothetical protein
MLRRLASLLMFRMSVSVSGVCAIPPPCFDESRMTLLAMIDVLSVSDCKQTKKGRAYWKPLDPCPPPELLYTPTN